jgi:hypothetical protein
MTGRQFAAARWRRGPAVLAAFVLTAAGLAGSFAAGVAPAAAATAIPRYDHVVVVMEENHSYSDIIGDTTDAPYINSLAQNGVSFTQSFAVEHPSQPNYLDLFSGSNQGVTSDNCPAGTFSADNLGAELSGAGLSFAGYSEGLPSDGSTVCSSGSYARKHVPWTDFSNVPGSDSKTFAEFPTDYSALPTVWVIPNLDDDMHDGTIAQGDTWLNTNLSGYAQWATTHNSLLVVTWDEDDYSESNQIPTIFYGAGLKSGDYGETINHYNVLRTLEDMYGLPHAGNAGSATPITDVFAGTTTGNTVTVTSPGNQTGQLGTAASLQISATDSAAGQSLTYSATGLPAGLGINSNTGLISGTPTTAGTSSVTVKATDPTGASGSATFSWTVSGTTGGGGCTAAQLLGNPGFETGGAAPWTTTSGVIQQSSSSEPAHSGNYLAWLDGYGTPHTDTLAQTVTVPAGCASATLSFWRDISTTESTSTNADDNLTVQVLDQTGNVLATLATYSNLNADNQYDQQSFSLAPYIGQTITVKFTGVENDTDGGTTNFLIDDTALNVS